MAISINSAAQYVCEKSGWSLTQLSLQKILYLAHMVFLGRNSTPMVSGSFEAWDYGPVHPVLYQKVKAFGAKPIPNVFWSQEEIPEEVKSVLDEACANLLGKSPADLVKNTHWENGAWAKHYKPQVRNIVISNKAIFDEYKQRMGRPKQAA